MLTKLLTWIRNLRTVEAQPVSPKLELPPIPPPVTAPPPKVGALGISDAGIQLIKEFEGLRLEAYQDGGGVWTVGYGSTGSDIKQGTVWTQAKAIEDLKRRCVVLGYRITQASGREFTQNQLDALISFAYNVGLHALLTSHLWTKFQCGDIEGAAEAFMRWTHDGGKEIKGLVRRRTREKEVFLGITSLV